MSQIQEMLQRVNALNSVRGSAVVTGDGIMVMDALQDRFREDVVSGLTSFLLLTMRRAMSDDAEEVDTRLDRFVLHATHGKLVVEHLGEAFLIVITDQFADLNAIMPGITEIAAELREAARIDF